MRGAWVRKERWLPDLNFVFSNSELRIANHANQGGSKADPRLSWVPGTGYWLLRTWVKKIGPQKKRGPYKLRDLSIR